MTKLRIDLKKILTDLESDYMHSFSYCEIPDIIDKIEAAIYDSKKEDQIHLTDDRLRKILTNFANAVYTNIYFTWDEKTTDKVVEEYLKGNLNKL
jgi:hypothetical protein